ncbi:MAG: tetratricopeptide repeat protein [Candidatus Cloacimonetes bacterium]|nr:tetratricopeptide repeat protein [Candidatus Cloacimonadota bacterium]
MKPKLAIETYFEALKHLDDNDESEIAADIYNNLGEVFRSSGDADKALEYFDKARNIYIKAENNERMALIYNNLAATNIITNDIPKAEEFCQLAMEYYKKYLTEPYFPVALNNLASLRSNQQRFDEAIELYNESLTIAKKYGNESLQTTVLNNLALIAIEREDYDSAVKSAQESLSTAHKLQDLISEKKAYSSLKDAWQFQLDIARAYLAQSMELELAQRINEVNTPLDIAQAEALFLQKKIERAVRGYRSQNETLEDSYKVILHKTQELETKNNLLTATNRLLNRIISIITHDVRGPVATILKLQKC